MPVPYEIDEQEEDEEEDTSELNRTYSKKSGLELQKQFAQYCDLKAVANDGNNKEAKLGVESSSSAAAVKRQVNKSKNNPRKPPPPPPAVVDLFSSGLPSEGIFASSFLKFLSI
jgi:hypothetical protein